MPIFGTAQQPAIHLLLLAIISNWMDTKLCHLNVALQGMLGNHEKDKNTLITTKAKLKVVNKELEEMRWSHEVLQQKYNQVSVAKRDSYFYFHFHWFSVAGEQRARGNPGEVLDSNP